MSELETQAETGITTVSRSDLTEIEPNLVREQAILVPAKPIEIAKHLVWLWLRPAEKLDHQEREVLKFMCQEEALQLAYTLGQSFLKIVKERRGLNWEIG